MLAKLTSKNQLTLPKSVVESVAATEYFDVEVREGQIVLTPVRILRGDAVRAKLAELGLEQPDVSAAVRWARSGRAPSAAGEPAARYAPKRKPAKSPPKSKGGRRG
jgi:hypothetical protein